MGCTTIPEVTRNTGTTPGAMTVRPNPLDERLGKVLLHPGSALVDYVRIHGWPTALARFVDETQQADPIDFTCGVDEIFQGGWSLFLEHPEEAVLAFDGNLGASACSLSRRCRNVVAVQLTRSSAVAVAERARSEGIGNLSVLAWEDLQREELSLPAFDLITIHDVDEFFPGPGPTGDRLQDLLAWATIRLKIDGTLFVSGSRDFDKIGLFRSLQAFRACGLKARTLIDFYEDIRAPAIIRTILDRDHGMWSPVRLGKYLVRSRNFGIVASRGNSDARRKGTADLLERIGKTGASGKAEWDGDVHVGSQGVLRLMTEREVIRLPRTEAGLRSCHANRDALNRMATTRLKEYVPASLDFSLEPLPYFSEERITGFPVAYERCGLRALESVTEQALDILEQMNISTPDTSQLDEPTFDKHFGDPIRRLLQGEREAKWFLPLLDRMRDRLLGMPFPCGTAHGDFKVSNFLADRKGRLVGLIDWDRSCEEAPLIVDAVVLAGFNLHLTSHLPWIEAILALPGERIWGRTPRRFMGRMAMGDAPLEPWVLLTVLHLLSWAPPLYLGIRRWRRENIDPVFDFLREIFGVGSGGAAR